MVQASGSYIVNSKNDIDSVGENGNFLFVKELDGRCFLKFMSLVDMEIDLDIVSLLQRRG